MIANCPRGSGSSINPQGHGSASETMNRLSLTTPA